MKLYAIVMGLAFLAGALFAVGLDWSSEPYYGHLVFPALILVPILVVAPLLAVGSVLYVYVRLCRKYGVFP